MAGKPQKTIPTVPDINQEPVVTGRKATKPVARKMTMQEYYRTEEQMEVMLSPMYQNHFGKVMPVCINGITVAIPVDGKVYKVPKTFASEINRRRVAIDASLETAERMADVSNNGEQYPGALNLT